MDTIPDRFPRAPGQAPRATLAAYAAAVLHATVSIAYGLLQGTGREVALGLLAAAFGAAAWVAIGTGLALLAQVADRR